MITISQTGLEGLASAVKNVEKELARNIAAAINATKKKAVSGIAKRIGSELSVTQREVRKQISATNATKEKSSSTVTLKESARLGLRHFGAKQNAAGVRYKISKTKGARTVAGAFQGPRPGVMKASWKGNAFKRVGKKRLPIVKLYGPSPWGVFSKNNMTEPQLIEIETELKKQVQLRIRYLTLKAAGKLANQKN